MVLAVAGGAQGSRICSWHARVLHLLQLPHAAAVCCAALPDSKLMRRRRQRRRQEHATALPSTPLLSPAQRRTHLDSTVMPGWLCSGMRERAGRQKMPSDTLLSS